VEEAKTIIQLNIDHFRRLLQTEADEGRRETIARLLAEQEAELAKLLKKKEK
jgi:hypothetical protein